MKSEIFNSLARPFRLRRLLGLKRILYLPHILSHFEKRLFLILIIIATASGGGLLAKTYFRFTMPIPNIGGTYVEGALKEPRHINPIYASTDGDRDIERLIFSRPLIYSGLGELQYDLAENIKISEDEKVYEMYLKKNIKWHDGRELNADDVVFTIRLIQNPQYKSPLRLNWQGVSVEKIDDFSVKFILRTPYTPFIENLTVGILPKHLWEGIGPEQATLHKLNLEPIGSGPYEFNEIKKDEDGTIKRYVLQRNRDYYRGGPYISRVEFLFFKNEEEMLSSWRRGLIHGFGPFPTVKLTEIDTTKDTIQTINMPRVFGLFFNNQSSSLFSNKTLRRATALNINNGEIISLVSSGGAIPNESSFPAGSFGYTSEVTKYPHDPTAAVELLEADGWKDLDGDGIRDKKRVENKKETVQSLKFKLATADWPDFVKIANYIKKELDEAGINVEIEIKNFGELDTSVIRPRNFDMLLFGQVYGHEPDPFAFWHSSQIKEPGLNVAMYNNKKVDSLLEESRQTTDILEREEKFEEIQKLISDDLPAVFFYSQLYLYLLPAYIRGVELTTISLPADRFNEINKWYINTKRVPK